jgi:deazaflavin-dependent oxidoreductase (nitroreductase family)
MHNAMASTPSCSRPNIPSLLSDRQGMLARLVFRLPLTAYRLGLGWMLGHQFLVLTHAGRSTGSVHQTVLKVLHYDRLTHESIVASAWGDRTDWFRNIQVRSAVAVQTANEWYVPEQRALSADEAFAVFNDCVRRQHWFARLMLAQIGQRVDVPEAQLRALVDSLPFVAFRPARVESRRRAARNALLGGDLR